MVQNYCIHCIEEVYFERCSVEMTRMIQITVRLNELLKYHNGNSGMVKEGKADREPDGVMSGSFIRLTCNRRSGDIDE